MYNPTSVMFCLLEAFLQLRFDVFDFKCCIKICTVYILLQLVSQLHKNTLQMQLNKLTGLWREKKSNV